MHPFDWHECMHLIGSKPCIREARKPAFQQTDIYIPVAASAQKVYY
jgi:hypothetical protein